MAVLKFAAEDHDLVDAVLMGQRLPKAALSKYRPLTQGRNDVGIGNFAAIHPPVGGRGYAAVV